MSAASVVAMVKTRAHGACDERSRGECVSVPPPSALIESSATPFPEDERVVHVTNRFHVVPVACVAHVFCNAVVFHFC